MGSIRSRYANWRKPSRAATQRFDPRYDEERASIKACWDHVGRFLGALSPELYSRGVLLKDDLATFLSPAGRLDELWTGDDDDFPLLHFHRWLSELAGSAGADVVHAIDCAVACSAAAAFLQEAVLDQSSQRDASDGLLVGELLREADAQLRGVLGNDTEFWRRHQRVWRQCAEGLSQRHRAERRSPDILAIEPEAFAARLGFAKLGMLALIARGNAWGLWSRLEPAVEDVSRCLCILRAFGSLRTDLARWRYNPLLAATARTAGMDARIEAGYDAWLAALCLSGAAQRAVTECLAQLERSRQALAELPEFARYAERLGKRFREIADLIGGRTPVAAEAAATPPIVETIEPTLHAVVRMAEGFLLADPTYRDAWEVQRRAVFGTTELTSRAFPTGVVLELLGCNGIEVADAVDRVMGILDASGYRYYEHPHLPPDSDDVALALRLAAYTGDHRWGASLRRPLSWIQMNQLPAGEIPVWLTRQLADPPSGSLRLWGDLCVTVEANLLRGLIAYDFDAHRNLIAAAAVGLCARFAALGLGANAHYVPLYALWSLAELCSLLRIRFVGGEWDARIAQLHEDIQRCLSLQVRTAALTPQEAALSLLASAAIESGKLDSALANQWIAAICRAQRYDGSWAAEPLYGTPGRNEEATWYHSRSATSAHCYHALKVYQQLSMADSARL
jgi:hypothetical protein